MRASLAALVVAVGVGSPALARAQHCHVGALDDVPADPDAAHVAGHAGHAHGDEHHVAIDLTLDGALLDDGAYQGLVPSLRWHHGRFGAYAALPVYRLDLDAMPTVGGPGDAVVQAQARVVGHRLMHAGVVVAVGLPIGSADDRLGMGHVMAMPGVWAASRRGHVTVVASLSVGKTLGPAGVHDAHRGPPAVNPMSSFEVGGTVRGGVELTSAASVHAVVDAAVPIESGPVRADAGAGGILRRGSWAASGQVLIGVAGDPFRVRGLLSVAHTF